MSINFELLDLRAFLAVYDHRSFSVAADLLHLSQPALSRRVRGLENRLLLPLFERSTRHVLPTTAGFRFEPMARRLLDELDASLVSIGAAGGDRHSGQLTIASLPSAAAYLLPRVIKKFSKRYPLVRLRVLERLVAEGLQCVICGEAEFGINVNLPTEIDVTFSPLLDDPYVFVCNRRHPLAKKKSIVWQDLSGQSLIGIGRPPDSGNPALLEGLSKAKIQLNWRYEVNNFTTALRLIEDNLGATVMPSMGSPRRRNSRITIVPLSPLNLARSIGIVERRRGRLSPPAKYLRDILIGEME